MEVIIQKDYEQMSKAAAKIVVEVLNAKPNAVLGMATGSAPLGLYQELVRLLRSGRAQPAQITEKVARIRRIRATIQRQSAQAKQELRQVVTPRQEATLILMGYLD